MNKYYEIESNNKIKYIDIDVYVLYKSLKIKTDNSKKLIDNYSSRWDYYKKINNKYEYIYNNRHNNIFNVNITPISRSYFKLQEITIDCNIDIEDCIILCMAEAPGGFVKNIIDRTTNTKIYANSLLSNDRKIPSWNNMIINRNRVNILNGVDNTGNIYNIDNINDIIEKVRNKCHLITADGGMDYSSNYNNQEYDSYKLLICEIYLTLCTQKINGHFILKIFDIFNYKTVQLLYILNLFYKKVNIVKPHSSRCSNSEKYIVCMNFNDNSKDLDLLKTKIYDYIKLNRKIDLFIPLSFIMNIYDYNKVFVEKQSNHIKSTIELIKNKDNINNKIYDNLEYSKEWHNKYIPNN